jgi:polysaccharide biosynthesis/export protein
MKKKIQDTMKIFLKLIVCVLYICSPVLSIAQDYLVGEGDLLKITIYEHADIATVVRVASNGRIGVPLLGQVSVTGMTVARISKKLAKLYSDGYIVNPQVSVFIEEYRSKKAIILGQVKSPGLYELRGYTTFLELISKAGGFTGDAGSKAIVKRKSGKSHSSENIITIDINSLVENGNMDMNISIEDGDSVYVTQEDVFYVTGEVKKPASYKYEKGTTVIKAVTMAGGFTGKAAKSSGRIIRNENGKETIIHKIRMDEPVLPGDVIIIPESFF